MTLKEVRDALSQQINLVRLDAENIPQAESVANLAGKMVKVIQLEIQSEYMRAKGEKFKILDDLLGKSE